MTRLAALDSASLWADELFSIYWSRSSLGFLWGEGRRLETNPPLYFTLLHFWMLAFGDSAVAVRLLSVVFSVAAVPLAYTLGRVVFGRGAGLLAGLFLAVSPMSVIFGQEARPYALVALADSVALLAIALYATRGHTAEASVRGLAHQIAWALVFTAAALVSFFSHYTSLFFIAACFVGVAAILIGRRPFPVKDALLWAAAGLVVIACIAEPLLVAASLSRSPNIAWIPLPGLDRIVVFFAQIVVGDAIRTRPVGAILAGLVYLVLLYLLIRRLPGRVPFSVLVVIPATFCLFVIALSLLSRPILIQRISVWLSIPLFVLLAGLIMQQRDRRWRSVFAVGTALTLLACLLPHYWFPKKEDWRRLAQIMTTGEACQGAVAFFPETATPLGLLYYAPELASRRFLAVEDPMPGEETAEFFIASRVVPLPSVGARELTKMADSSAPFVILIRDHRPERAHLIPAWLTPIMEGARQEFRLSGDLWAFCR